MAILPALRWRKWGCGRPYRQAFFVPEQLLCRNAAPARPFFVPRHTLSVCDTKKRAGTLFRVLIRMARSTHWRTVGGDIIHRKHDRGGGGCSVVVFLMFRRFATIEAVEGGGSGGGSLF